MTVRNDTRNNMLGVGYRIKYKYSLITTYPRSSLDDLSSIVVDDMLLISAYKIRGVVCQMEKIAMHINIIYCHKCVQMYIKRLTRCHDLA